MNRGLHTLAIAAALCGACGGSGPSCPNQSTVCPTPAPSYAGSVSAIIQNRCASCHSPGGQEAAFPFDTYQQVFNYRGPMLNQLYACRMPPSTAQQPSSQERDQLVGWLVCGAPEN